jgi:hypothetical protein
MNLPQLATIGLLSLPLTLSSACGLTGEEWASIFETGSEMYIADREAKRAQRQAAAAQANYQAMQLQQNQFQYVPPPNNPYHPQPGYGYQPHPGYYPPPHGR